MQLVEVNPHPVYVTHIMDTSMTYFNLDTGVWFYICLYFKVP